MLTWLIEKGRGRTDSGFTKCTWHACTRGRNRGNQNIKTPNRGLNLTDFLYAIKLFLTFSISVKIVADRFLSSNKLGAWHFISPKSSKPTSPVHSRVCMGWEWVKCQETYTSGPVRCKALLDCSSVALASDVEKNMPAIFYTWTSRSARKQKRV